jgi:hypothetical protein
MVEDTSLPMQGDGIALIPQGFAMATQAPPAPTKKKAVNLTQPKGPPDDSIWVRYNEHGEFPVSLVSSLTLHALAIGVLFFLGKFVFDQYKAKPLPVEAIEISGGGNGIGNGIGDGIGDGSDRESGAGQGDGSVIEGPPEEGQLTLNAEEMKALAIEFKDDPDALRVIEKGSVSFKELRAMSSSSLNKIRTGTNPGGKNGTGIGGKAGGNDGDGTGGPKGRPKSARMKRKDRWWIDFERRGPEVYLEQLQSMGAFLAVPVSYDSDKKPSYRTIHDLKARPAKVLDEDAAKLGLIYWYNNDPIWTELIMREMQINMKPSHFIVLFPLELEEEFAAEEARYLKAKRLDEDRIKFTHFHLELRGKRLMPVAYSHDLK